MSTGPLVRAVVFDAVGTILVPDPPVVEAYRAAAARYGVRIDVDEIRRRFQAAFAEQEVIDHVSGNLRTNETRERDRWRSIVASVFRGVDGFDREESLFDDLWRHFAEPRHWRFTEGFEAVWAELLRRRLTLAIASNFDERLLSLCRTLPPLDACRHVFVSSQLGVRKPAREFYDHIARALNIPGGEILMVGDDFENDYQAALTAGWQARLVSNERGLSIGELRSWPVASGSGSRATGRGG